MPQRINGIGTTYLGKSNVLARPGVCEGCGRGVELGSYDSRLWFTFFFIPIVPLGRKRILDYCPACTTHRALPLAEWEALKKKNLEEAARKALAEPASGEAQAELHRVCLVMGEWEKADAFQKKLEDEFARDAKVQLYLAGAHAYRGRAAEAEAALARARALDPSIAPPAAPEPPPPPARGSSRRAAVLLGILAVLVAVGMSIASLSKAARREVHLVSGFDKILTVEIAGRPAVSVAGGGKLTLTLPEGKHRARVSGAATEEIEFVVESSFFTRLFDDRVFVLNPGGAALCVVYETAYSAEPIPEESVAPFRPFFGQRFFSVDDIDYVFAPFPSQIRTKSSGVILKRRIDLFREPPAGLVFALAGGRRSDEALALAENVIRTRPADREALLPVYVGLAEALGKTERALALLRERVAARPLEVEAHRHYQRLQRGEREALKKDYDAALAGTPDDPDLLYLRGRLEPRLSAARAWYEKALAVDPKHVWSNYALGFGRASLGDWAGARSALAKAVEARPSSAEFKAMLRRARLGAGEIEVLERELREELRKAPAALATRRELARVLVAAGRAPEARELLGPFRDLLRRMNEPDAAGHVRQLEADILYAAADFTALSALPAADPKETPADRAVALLELGRVEEALKAAPWPDVLLLLAAVLARPDDAALREKAAAALEEADPDARPLARALRSGAAEDVDAALDASVDVGLKAASLAVLVPRVPARAAELRERAAALNRLFVFPYHAVRRALESR